MNSSYFKLFQKWLASFRKKWLKSFRVIQKRDLSRYTSEYCCKRSTEEIGMCRQQDSTRTWLASVKNSASIPKCLLLTWRNECENIIHCISVGKACIPVNECYVLYDVLVAYIILQK